MANLANNAAPSAAGWHVQPGINGDPAGHYVCDARGHALAWFEHERDAVLAAAAPAMLEALTGAHGVLCGERQSRVPLMQRWPAMLEAIGLAILRARA
ncbi:hypothetical protein ACFOWT_09780 [Croceibacterium xixiisoli]